jgi:hypothetical protein
VENRRHDLARASLIQLLLIERADQQHPTVPPCTIKRPGPSQSAMAALAPSNPGRSAWRTFRE